MTVRPPPPDRELPDGWEWVAAEEDKAGWLAWRSIDPGSRRCRWLPGPRAKACGGPAVAEINRQRRARSGEKVDCWWAYCADHLYGRWVEGGRVLRWSTRPVAR